tara:strand:+ start:12 stop:962 length:951 start_codon:yes stop_codon:yes gene_type:complete
MKKILYLTNEIEDKQLSLRDVGNNYGNLCFYYGTINILKDHDIYFNNQIDNPDYIVVSIANSICNIKCCINHLQYINKVISKYTCKKILLSIGAQNNDLEMFKLEENNKLVINNFLKQFDFINLRGNYTRDLLIYNNIIFNYNVLGCPSIYLCKPINVNKIKLNNKSHILFNAPRTNQKNCGFIQKLIKDKSIYFLYQDMYIESRSNIIGPSNYDNWKTIVNKYEFTIGTRIHGAIMSLTCKIPTLLLVIDSRTFELAEIFKIPYINIMNKNIKLENKTDIINLINNYSFDYKMYNNYIDEYKSNIKSILSKQFDL